jgi:hypothetical protein
VQQINARKLAEIYHQIVQEDALLVTLTQSVQHVVLAIHFMQVIMFVTALEHHLIVEEQTVYALVIITALEAIVILVALVALLLLQRHQLG